MDKSTPSPLIAADRSLVAERDDGVDAHGATGGEEAGEGAGAEEQEEDPGVGLEVEAAHVEEERREKARQEERAGDPCGEADRGQAQALAEDQPQDRAPRSAEGEADTDFARAAADVVGDDAVDPDEGEEERGRAEEAEKTRAEPGLRDRVVDDL